MTTTSLVLTITLLGALVAGCSGPAPNAAAQSSVGQPGDPLPDAAQQSPALDEANVAPTAAIAANVTRGKAPLAVDLTLAGSDPEGQALTWAVDLDGDGRIDESGSTLPAHVQHSFKPGAHAVCLAVDDGNRFTLSTIDIVAEA